MDREYVNAEGYPDPTCYAALNKLQREDKAIFRPLVYICSPYRGDERENTLRAQYYCRFAVSKGYIPIAPHIYFTQFLADQKESERSVAIFMNLVLLGKCHELWCFGEKVSDGMQVELDKAKHLRKILRYFTEDLEETSI